MGIIKAVADVFTSILGSPEQPKQVEQAPEEKALPDEEALKRAAAQKTASLQSTGRRSTILHDEDEGVDGPTYG